MAVLFVAGQLINFLEQARLVTPSPSADSLFPASKLWDGYADSVFRHGSNSANPSLTIDLAMKDKSGVDNGNLDTWVGGSPTGWTETTTGTGVVTETTTAGEVRTGSAAKAAKGSGTAKLVRTFRVRSGQRLVYSIWMRIGGSGQAKAQLRAPGTNMYLTSGGAWQSAQTYFAQETSSTSYVEKTGTFTMENFLAHQADVVELELTLEDTGAGGGSDFAFFDDAYIWPAWNAVVVSGHNVEPGMAPQLRSSTDNFSGSNDLEVAMSVRQPAFFGYDAAGVTRRWARLALTGTQSSTAGAPYFGEVAVTYLETGARKMARDGYSIRNFPDNIVMTVPGGKTLASRAALQRRRVLQLPFMRTSDSEYREVRDEIHGRCHGVLHPIILVPVDTEDVVLHGRLNDSWEAKRLFTAFYDDDLVVSDNPFPRVVS